MLQIKNTLGGGKSNAPYAWAKYEVIPDEILTNPSIDLSYVQSSGRINITGASFDLSFLPSVTSSNGLSPNGTDNEKQVVDFFTGFKIATNQYKLYLSNDVLMFYFEAGALTITEFHNDTDGTWFTVAVNGAYSSFEKTLPFTGEKIGRRSYRNFIEYITDKSPTKYPNGEVHTDGFFYRYAPEGPYAWTKNAKNNSPTYSQNRLNDLPVNCGYGRCVIFNDNIYMVSPNADTSVYLYDESTDSWSVAATIPYTCGLYPSVCVYNNELHVMGGNDNKTKHYAWNGVSWREVSTLPYNVYTTDSVVYDNKLHIIGGNPSPTLHYSWDGTAWTSESTLPYTFNGGAAIIYENAIHILGTGNGSGIARHYVYNNDGSWTQSFDLPYAFSSAGVCVFDNHIYVCGGYNGETNFYRWNGSSWESLYTLKENFIGDAKFLVSYHDKLYLIGNNKSSSYYKHAYILAAYEYSTFISYIVSDKETAYPDGAVHTDGYYYEKVSEGAQIAEGSKSGSNANPHNNPIIEHGLGVKPTNIIIYYKDKSYQTAGYANYKNDASEGYYANANNSVTGSVTISDVTETSFKLSGGNRYGGSGLYLYWIAIAE